MTVARDAATKQKRPPKPSSSERTWYVDTWGWSQGQGATDQVEALRRSVRATDAIERLLALLASGQISMCKVDGWQTLTTKLFDQPIDLAA